MRPIPCGISAFLAVAVGAAAGSVVSSTAGHEPPVVPDATTRALDERFALAAEVRSYKDRLLDDLVAGRTTLAAVADEFLRVDEDDPTVLAATMRKYAGGDDRDKSARHVLDLVRERLPDGADTSDVLGRLRAEYAAEFGYRLPDRT